MGRCLGPRAAHCWAAILQHDLYSPSALGLDVPPGCWLHSGSRGDSLHGLVHTSPFRRRVRPGGATVATTPIYVHPAAAERQRGQLQKKTAVVVTHNDCQGLALSNGGCNPRYELGLFLCVTRELCGAVAAACPHYHHIALAAFCQPPTYWGSDLCNPNGCAATPPWTRISPPLHRIECSHHPVAFQPNNLNPGYGIPRFPTSCN